MGVVYYSPTHRRGENLRKVPARSGPDVRSRVHQSLTKRNVCELVARAHTHTHTITEQKKKRNLCDSFVSHRQTLLFSTQSGAQQLLRRRHSHPVGRINSPDFPDFLFVPSISASPLIAQNSDLIKFNLKKNKKWKTGNKR